MDILTEIADKMQGVLPKSKHKFIVGGNGLSSLILVPESILVLETVAEIRRGKLKSKVKKKCQKVSERALQLASWIVYTKLIAILIQH